ncbi:MAG TPA: VCBS repeat-containing protein [Candidatus Latescibacteria bacterium]|nr:VCBS repeat-containing protein [Candidatus Latescibacterota bacterium]
MPHASPFNITSSLPTDVGHIPISAGIDFGPLLLAAGEGSGARLDPTSVEVVDLTDGATIPHHLAEDFAHGDRGCVEFVIRNPTHVHYELRFAAVRPGGARPHVAPTARVPMVGLGDLLRYNAAELRPITMFCFRLVDLDGDGRSDLAGTWNYYHRPGEPRSGVVCYPGLRSGAPAMLFGDQVRLRYREPGSDTLYDFPGTYVDADFGDLIGDGRPDLAFAEWNTGRVEFFRNSGQVDGGGWPIWERGHEIQVEEERVESMSLVDLDGDGVLDLLFNGRWIRNTNPDGWPFEAADPVDLGAGERVACLDVTGDGRLDAVCLVERESSITEHPDSSEAWPGNDVFWHTRLPGDTPGFGPALPVTGLPPSAHRFATARHGDRTGLLVQHGIWQEITFFEIHTDEDGAAIATTAGLRVEAANPPMTFSDQSWPCPCDWNGDGVTDLLIGGGYGWPRTVRNTGTNDEPSFAAPQLILSDGKPIRPLRDEILPPARHWHNMGYPYPSFVDWDGDGRPDLMLPNETNRIFWYRNTGTREQPVFGARQQLIVDGYPDDDEKRATVGQRALDKDLPNHPYPFDDTSPFFWRCGACFADFTGDGFVDMITHDEQRKLTLFAQYIDDAGIRQLRKDRRLRLVDGREIDDGIVGRDRHWTESFRAVDWNGDGRLDLIYNTAGSGHIYLLANVGSVTEPVFDLPRQFLLYGKPFTPFTIHGPNAWPCDLNGDGRPDLIGCVEWSVYPFFAHAALEMDRHPDWELGPVTGVHT